MLAKDSNIDPQVANVINDAPESVRSTLMALRQLIYSTAQELQITHIEESLKWGQPSYSAKQGSPIRLGFKSSPPRCYLYFHCQSKLVSTFRELYSCNLSFEGNRAIVLKVDEAIPHYPIVACIKLALQYHHIKHLPLLGA